MTTNQSPPSIALIGPHLRAMSELHLIDHIQMVHNALGAVHSLAIPSRGMRTGANGCPDSLHVLARDHFVDLLEIINDRLGMALEMEENRAFLKAEKTPPE